MEWKKGADNEDIQDEHYSHLTGQNTGALADRSKLPLIIIGGGVICLIVLFFVLNPKPPQNKFPDIRPIEARLGQLEERINRLEMIKDQLKNTEDQVRILSESLTQVQETAKTVQTNSQTLAELQKKLAEMAVGEKKTDKTASGAGFNPPPPIVNAKEIQKASPEHGVLYHTVQKGETLFRISQKYGISVQKLREINQLDETSSIFAGQKLIVGPVKKP